MRIRSSDDEDLDIMDLSQVLDRTDSDDFSTHAQGELTMATKKSAAASAAPAATETAAPVKGKKTKQAAAPAPAPEPEAKGTFGPRAVPEGYTGINKLAEELGTSPAAMRRRLRGMEGMSKPEGQHGWYWKDGSKELAAVKKAFAAEPAAK